MRDVALQAVLQFTTLLEILPWTSSLISLLQSSWEGKPALSVPAFRSGFNLASIYCLIVGAVYLPTFSRRLRVSSS